MGRFNRKYLYPEGLRDLKRQVRMKLKSFGRVIYRSDPTATAYVVDGGSIGHTRHDGDAASGSYVPGQFAFVPDRSDQKKHPDSSFVRRIILRILDGEEFDKFVDHVEDLQLHSQSQQRKSQSPTQSVEPRISLTDLRLATEINATSKKILKQLIGEAVSEISASPEPDEVRRWKREKLSVYGTQGRKGDYEIAQMDADHVVDETRDLRKKWSRDTQGIEDDRELEKLINKSPKRKRFRKYLGLTDEEVEALVKTEGAMLDGTGKREVLDHERRFRLTDEEYEYEERRVVAASFLSATLLLLHDVGYTPSTNQGKTAEESLKDTVFSVLDTIQEVSRCLDKASTALTKSFANRSKGHPPRSDFDNYRAVHLRRMGLSYKEIARAFGRTISHREIDEEGRESIKGTKSKDWLRKMLEKGLQVERDYFPEVLEVFERKDEADDQKFAEQVHLQWSEWLDRDDNNFIFDMGGSHMYPDEEDVTFEADSLLMEFEGDEYYALRRALIQLHISLARGIDPMGTQLD